MLCPLYRPENLPVEHQGKCRRDLCAWWFEQTVWEKMQGKEKKKIEYQRSEACALVVIADALHSLARDFRFVVEQGVGSEADDEK